MLERSVRGEGRGGGWSARASSSFRAVYLISSAFRLSHFQVSRILFPKKGGCQHQHDSPVSSIIHSFSLKPIESGKYRIECRVRSVVYFCTQSYIFLDSVSVKNISFSCLLEQSTTIDPSSGGLTRSAQVKRSKWFSICLIRIGPHPAEHINCSSVPKMLFSYYPWAVLVLVHHRYQWWYWSAGFQWGLLAAKCYGIYRIDVNVMREQSIAAVSYLMPFLRSWIDRHAGLGKCSKCAFLPSPRNKWEAASH